MDTAALNALVLAIIILLVCSFFGIKLFIKYRKTRKIKYLILSILLGSIALLIFLLLMYAIFRSVTVVYGPPPINDYTPPINNYTHIGDSNVTPPHIVYGPPPR